jgi:LysM repeat protein
MDTNAQVNGVFTQQPQYERKNMFRLKSSLYKHLFLTVCTVVMLCTSFALYQNEQSAHAANPGSGNACNWYTVRSGDTLANIAWRDHTSLWTLARVNGIPNINLIFVGQRLCIPYAVRSGQSNTGSQGGQTYSTGYSGVLASGSVQWYSYGALEWSTQTQTASLLRQVAANYGLPANLVMAIAWQESGWTQHVIARDGGIGVMQLMPYTAMSLNASTGIRRDPYKLWDNLNLGATYLRYLWNNFHGNLYDVISAYNEGGWAVIHEGIFNWRYVNNVLYLMRVF